MPIRQFPDLFLHTPLKSFPYLSDNTLFTSLFEHYIQDDYFDYYDIPSNFSNIKIPIYHLGGWYDTFLEGTIKSYQGLQQNGGKGAKGIRSFLWAAGHIKILVQTVSMEIMLSLKEMNSI